MIQTQGKSGSLMLCDDDVTFCRVLSRVLEKRGFAVTVAHSVEQALPLVQNIPPAYAIVDLKMSGASGLILVEALHQLNPRMRIVVLTGYASVSTAVEAVKLGATQYLSKPANTDEIVAAFSHQAKSDTQIDASTLTLDRLEWEHIQRVLREHDNNISSAARTLNMHRRTLQRKLHRFSPP